jgi:hypothetical protein
MSRTLQAADIHLPMRMNRLPLVRGMLNSKYPAYFVVDTGGELISISAETALSLAMPPVRRIPLKVYGMSGVDENAFLLPGELTSRRSSIATSGSRLNRERRACSGFARRHRRSPLPSDYRVSMDRADGCGW